MSIASKDCWRCNNKPKPKDTQRLALCDRCLRLTVKEIMRGKGGNPLRASPFHTRGPRQS